MIAYMPSQTVHVVLLVVVIVVGLVAKLVTWRDE